jgi:hypothetical protein
MLFVFRQLATSMNTTPTILLSEGFDVGLRFTQNSVLIIEWVDTFFYMKNCEFSSKGMSKLNFSRLLNGMVSSMALTGC